VQEVLVVSATDLRNEKILVLLLDALRGCEPGVASSPTRNSRR